jgi:transposase InsO family protein
MSIAIPAVRPHKVYDPRLRDLVFHTGDVSIARDFGVPRSTRSDWRNGRFRDVVTLDVFDHEKGELQAEVLMLRRQLRICRALLGLLVGVLRVCDFQLEGRRLPEGKQKDLLLKAIDRATKSLPLKAVLTVVGLSMTRYHSWRRAQVKCELDDRPSCPKSQPTRICAEEVRTIHEMATSEQYRHLPISRLALLAQRLKKVYASASTWARLIRERGWRRPRQRVYPAKAKVGVRAERPDEYWHVDASIIKLLDGTKVFIHAVIDNLSRKVLSWRVAERLAPETTRAILLEALQNANLSQSLPKVVMDSGVENINGEVDELLSSQLIKRILALVQVDFSNSIVEALWRSAKFQWLFINELRTVADVRRLVAFFVEQHNTVPHSSFKGQTPDELYHGTGDDVVVELAQARAKARRERLAKNRTACCSVCPKAA